MINSSLILSISVTVVFVIISHPDASAIKARTTAPAPSAQKYRPGDFSMMLILCPRIQSIMSVGENRASAPRVKSLFLPKYLFGAAAVFVKLQRSPPDTATLRAGCGPISTMATSCPLCAACVAANNPDAPAPIIITSYFFMIIILYYNIIYIAIKNPFERVFYYHGIYPG